MSVRLIREGHDPRPLLAAAEVTAGVLLEAS